MEKCTETQTRDEQVDEPIFPQESFSVTSAGKNHTALRGAIALWAPNCISLASLVTYIAPGTRDFTRLVLLNLLLFYARTGVSSLNALMQMHSLMPKSNTISMFVLPPSTEEQQTLQPPLPQHPPPHQPYAPPPQPSTSNSAPSQSQNSTQAHPHHPSAIRPA